MRGMPTTIHEILDDLRASALDERDKGDKVVIRWDHSTRRSAARASRKLGVLFVRYQGLGVQVRPVGWLVRYQHQMVACSHRERAAARSGPRRFQDWGLCPPRSCLTSRKQTSMAQREA